MAQDYSIIEWSIREPRDRSAWTERGHYATLAEARRAALGGCREGLMLAISKEKDLMVVYHGCREILLVGDL